MINHIHINNFLSHKKTELELSDGVNIIVGPTDSGKSAIIRALRWLIENRPLGDSMRSYWGGVTQVGIIIDGDYYVGRTKSNSKNQYSVGEVHSSNYQDFQAIKTDVPEEITKILNLSPVSLQTQFESHFLLSRSPGEVAQFFNRIANLDKIDVGLRNIQSWLRQEQGRISTHQEQLLSLEEQLKQYRYINTLEKEIKRLETIEIRISNYNMDVSRLNELVSEAEELDERLETLEDLLGVEEQVTGLLEIEKELSDAKSDMNDIIQLSNQLIEIESDIESYEQFIGAGELVNELEDLFVELVKVNKEKQEIKTALKYLTEIQQAEQDAQTRLEQLEEQFHKGIGEVCPLCGQKIE